MEQKVIQVGNSLAVTLPSSFVKGKKIKPGQKIFVQADAETDVMHVSTKKQAVSSITPEFKQWLDTFNKKYKDALTELAKR